jgi:competence protein ComEA
MFKRLFVVLSACFALQAFAATDANKAQLPELESVQGIGPALAGKIVQSRADGPFKSWGDLIERVRGVGPKSAARLSAAGLTVGGLAYEGSAATQKSPQEPKAAKPARTPAAEQPGKAGQDKLARPA